MARHTVIPTYFRTLVKTSRLPETDSTMCVSSTANFAGPSSNRHRGNLEARTKAVMPLIRHLLIKITSLGALAAYIFLRPSAALADGPEQPNDHKIVLGHVGTPLPENPLDASYTFESRASAILQFVACLPEASPPPPSTYQGALNSNFGDMLEEWGQDALAKLAYTGNCGGSLAADRYRAIDQALSTISNEDKNSHFRLLGTDVQPPTSFGPVTEVRYGDLDTGLKELIPIVYLFRAKLRPSTYCQLLNFLMSNASGDGLVLGPGAPTWRLAVGPGSAYVPETENHVLLELSEQYLINQRLTADNFLNLCPAQPSFVHNTSFSNTKVHDYLMQLLRGILTTDFFEYNSKPYAHFALYAMENLADFAADSDIQHAAQMVLDLQAAKYAVSSSLSRRSSPYRRRGSHDGNLFDGTYSDEQSCRFYLYSGQLQVLRNDANSDYSADTVCWEAVREAVGSYRVPNPILDIAMNKSTRYFQTISGGPNYYAALWGGRAGPYSPVLGPVEVYDNEGPFLINAGGVPQNNGLPVEVSGISGDLTGAFGGSSCYGPNGDCFSESDEDTGISLPTLLIPYDPEESNLPLWHTVNDRRGLVRIQGTGHVDANLCVAPGFACGKNPTMPLFLNGCSTQPPLSCSETDGPWQFASIKGSPVRTYVAMLSAPAYAISQAVVKAHPACSLAKWPFNIGLFEAEPATKFANFNDFKTAVERNNPLGMGLFVEQDAFVDVVPPDFPTSAWCPQRDENNNLVPGTYLVTGWQVRYRKTDGTDLNLTMPSLFESAPSYWLRSPNARLPNADTSTWDLADGPIQADHSGNISITDPNTGFSCQLNITNVHSPTRSCNDVVYNAHHSGFAVQGTSGVHGNFEMVVPEGSRLVHYRRDNNAAPYPWNRGSDIIAAPNLSATNRWTVQAANVFQTNFGDLESVAWVHHYGIGGGLVNGGSAATVYDDIEHFWLSNGKWMGPDQVAPDGHAIQGVTGKPGFIQSTSGKRGNFELVVPEGGRLVHYWRDNDAAGYPWHQGADIIAAPNGKTTGRWTVQGANLFLGLGGTLETVAWVHHYGFGGSLVNGGGVATAYDDVEHFWLSNGKWTGPDVLTADGNAITPTATPAIIMGAFGKRGNFEMVVPEGNRLVHYWRDNDATGYPWHKGSDLIAAPMATSTLKWTVQGVNLFQSNVGDLEVIAWVHYAPHFVAGNTAPASDDLLHYRLDRSTLQWTGPDAVPLDTQQLSGQW